MRDDYCRPVLGGAVKCCLNLLLAANVDGTCRFVKNDDGGFLDNASSDCDALSLSSAKVDTSIATQGVITLSTLVSVRFADENWDETYIWQSRDKLVGECFFASSDHKRSLYAFGFSLPRRTYQSMSYIFENGPIEEKWFLLY